MNKPLIKSFYSILIIQSILISLSIGQNRKERIVLDFLDARFSGDAKMVKSLSSRDFIYFNTPYVGLGITTEWKQDSLIIKDISEESPAFNQLHQKDLILEINHALVSQHNSRTENPFKGPIGKSIQLAVQSSDSSNFTEYQGTLALIQEKQDLGQFLDDIQSFASLWEMSELQNVFYFSKRNNIVISYNWIGNKEGESVQYTFSTIEIYEINPINKTVKSIQSQWSEKQLIDQIKGAP
ncbi:MAG: hypothetical protein ISR83_07675 [Candidatus Marinimicrobia bacterium]|nr:hypothetical protein [Candidatus Neomarinimicrobiota bacterium]